jgi:DNA replicative helicase MCM subunit Mcm2 (Cdc46/Mcm family)
VDRVKYLCKSVGHAKKTLDITEKDLETLRKRIQQAKSEREKKILQAVIERKERGKKEAEDIVYSFMKAVDGLENEERNVMIQLYVKGRRWREIESLDGKLIPMSKATIIYKRALRHMALTE